MLALWFLAFLPARAASFVSFYSGATARNSCGSFVSAESNNPLRPLAVRTAAAAAGSAPAAAAAPRRCSVDTGLRMASAGGRGSSGSERRQAKQETAATTPAEEGPPGAAAAGRTVAVGRDQDLADYFRWAGEEIGVKAPKLKGGFVDGLRGLVATQDIAKNDEMVVVPGESALITTTDQPCPFPEWVDKDYWAKSPWQVRLALLLLREKREGAGSQLGLWISSLPAAFGTPVTWSAAELAELHYPYLESAAQDQRDEWKGFHSSLMASSPKCKVTEEELSWAMGVAYSRAFSGPYEGRGPKERLAEVAFVTALAGGSLGLGLGTVDQVANGAFAVLLSIPLRDFFMTKLLQLKRYALTPVVDLINHRSGIDSDVSFNYFYGYFAVTTQRAWAAGEQVFISYGPRSNDHLLQRYGFVEADNPNDVYRITGLVDKLSALLGEESVRVLRESGGAIGGDAAEAGGGGRADKSPVDSITVGRKGVFGEKEEARVLPVLRLAVVKDDQLAAGKMASISLQDFSKEISPANELAARRALLELCTKERESFPTTLGQDETFVSSFGKSMGANKRVALAFRMEKKRVLDAAIASMRRAEDGRKGDLSSSSPSTAVTA